MILKFAWYNFFLGLLTFWPSTARLFKFRQNDCTNIIHLHYFFYIDVDPPSVPYLFSQFYFTNSVKTISWIIPTICSNEESSVLVYSNSTRLMLTHNIFNIPANELFPNLRLFIEVYTGGSICSVSSFTLEIPSNGEDNRNHAIYQYYKI